MRVMAHVAMVMNLDKCIGCHTCTVTCKQVWTNRPGTEYVYFNNVETKPGIGYPKRYEDQEQWHGGWTLDRKGRLQLKAGGRLRKLLSIFYNPDLPSIDDYGDPFTYDYQHVIEAPLGTINPSAHSISALTGRDMNVNWGSNFDDDLAGAPELAVHDPNLAGLQEQVKMEFEQVFMFYLPRICEHCLNPSCVASCPSGAIYKREEDGIVLVDQDRCRGWRFCVSGCPYKKVYFNHRTGKAEKCTFCYPRIEQGMPTICSETCVGRLRYLGLFLYDADRVLDAAATPDVQDLYEAQLGVFLDPHDPTVQAEAARAGIPHDWMQAAQRSPVYELAVRHKVALPLHPEYRTLPMVWYIPPLSPVADVVNAQGYDANPDNVFATIDALRIPIDYLANLFTAGDSAVIRTVLRKLTTVRAIQRAGQLGCDFDESLPATVGATADDLDDLYRLLAIAKYEDRYVIPPAHTEEAGRLMGQHEQLFCSLDTDGGPGMGGHGPPGPHGIASYSPTRTPAPDAGGSETRFNLLNWNGSDAAPGMFPQPGPA
ncbi:MAG: nitrate reductase subunit beta [Mycobacterium sp.]